MEKVVREATFEEQYEILKRTQRSYTHRQTPKKPNLWGDRYDSDGNIIYDMWDCPRCGKSYEIDCDRYDYCPNCGQAIDWSDL